MAVEGDGLAIANPSRSCIIIMAEPCMGRRKGDVTRVRQVACTPYYVLPTQCAAYSIQWMSVYDRHARRSLCLIR